jgi:hypothetical protein
MRRTPLIVSNYQNFDKTSNKVFYKLNNSVKDQGKYESVTMYKSRGLFPQKFIKIADPIIDGSYKILRWTIGSIVRFLKNTQK